MFLVSQPRKHCQGAGDGGVFVLEHFTACGYLRPRSVSANVAVLPRAYRDVVEVLAAAGGAMRAVRISSALGGVSRRPEFVAGRGQPVVAGRRFPDVAGGLYPGAAQHDEVVAAVQTRVGRL